MVPKREYAAAAVPPGVDPERPSFPRARIGSDPFLSSIGRWTRALSVRGICCPSGGPHEPLRPRRAAFCRRPRPRDHGCLHGVRVGAARPVTRSGDAWPPPRRAGRPAPHGVSRGWPAWRAIAAGRFFDSDLVRAVVAAIYAEPDDGDPGARRGSDPAHRLAGLLTACRLAARLLADRADPADSAAYRQWVQSVAARVCGRGPTGGGSPAARGARPARRTARFLDLLGEAPGPRLSRSAAGRTLF